MTQTQMAIFARAERLSLKIRPECVLTVTTTVLRDGLNSGPW